MGAKTEKNQRNPLTGSHLLPCPEKIARASKPRSPFHRTLARGRCCVPRASRCLGRSGDRQIQIHRDGLPIRPTIARSRVCFHPQVALARAGDKSSSRLSGAVERRHCVASNVSPRNVIMNSMSQFRARRTSCCNNAFVRVRQPRPASIGGPGQAGSNRCPGNPGIDAR